MKIGFLFPAFDDRCANLYNVLYSTKNLSDNHEELVTALFGAPIPMPAETQKEAFGGVLAGTLAEECSYDVVQTVHDSLLARVETQKEQKDEPYIPVTKQELADTLADCGISDEKVEHFAKQYDESFGETTALCPRNLVGNGKMELKTEDVTVRVDAAHSDLVETRLVDGKSCIVIRAEGQLTVNGIPVRIKK